MSNVSPTARIVPLRRPVCYWCILGVLVGVPVGLVGLGYLTSSLLLGSP